MLKVSFCICVLLLAVQINSVKAANLELKLLIGPNLPKKQLFYNPGFFRIENGILPVKNNDNL